MLAREIHSALARVLGEVQHPPPALGVRVSLRESEIHQRTIKDRPSDHGEFLIIGSVARQSGTGHPVHAFLRACVTSFESNLVARAGFEDHSFLVSLLVLSQWRIWRVISDPVNKHVPKI